MLEIVNTMLVAERRGRISHKAHLDALQRVKGLPLRIAPSPTVFSLEILRTMARRCRLSAYDAEYLRIAKETALPLATLDGSLRKAARQESVKVFGI